MGPPPWRAPSGPGARPGLRPYALLPTRGSRPGARFLVRPFCCRKAPSHLRRAPPQPECHAPPSRTVPPPFGAPLPSRAPRPLAGAPIPRRGARRAEDRPFPRRFHPGPSAPPFAMGEGSAPHVAGWGYGGGQPRLPATCATLPPLLPGLVPCSTARICVPSPPLVVAPRLHPEAPGLPGLGTGGLGRPTPRAERTCVRSSFCAPFGSHSARLIRAEDWCAFGRARGKGLGKEPTRIAKAGLGAPGRGRASGPAETRGSPTPLPGAGQGSLQLGR